MSGFEGFGPEAIAFLATLGTKKSDWFKANKKDYERLVVAPCKSFVEEMGEALQGCVSPGIVAEPRTNGSIAPINNDLRFSPGKPPYKDHTIFVCRWAKRG